MNQENYGHTKMKQLHKTTQNPREVKGASTESHCLSGKEPMGL